ncbi:SRPBCC domain-containing protein [Enterococcus saccharolyticus]|uniref:SRPBCC domain-containing protein n=1 Tax=Enterococcus saccharolyticus TaxID=41997 RepID=UPI001E5D1DE7|nr:SRPBCC domain-containing protein [Enterococcus saccharolyticus]MCD5001980.1 SRPBCC domain-containing protein [Enterococcus saccharolyticus]
MKEKLALVDGTLHAEFWLEINASPETVWTFLTETDKLAQWFPELQAGDISADGYMKFVMPEINLTMAIQAFHLGEKLAYQWDSGQVTFDILADKQTILHFSEELPPQFPQKHRDVAGRSIVLRRLKNAIEGQPVDFSNVGHAEAEQKFGKQLAAFESTK